MDIRKFLKRNSDNATEGTSHKSVKLTENISDSKSECTDIQKCSENVNSDDVMINKSEIRDDGNTNIETDYSELDIGRFVNTDIPDRLRHDLVMQPWTPFPEYNFAADVEPGKRPFRFQWLLDHKSWLTYSKYLKGALCKICVVFKPTIRRGVQGAFIKAPFKRYKHFSEQYKIHLSTEWHSNSVQKLNNFLKLMDQPQKSIVCQISKHSREKIEENRKVLSSIVSSIVFCGTHDISLRGKLSDKGNFIDLLRFRIESGDKVFEQHLESCKRNEKYISVRIQNELIKICGQTILEQIMDRIKRADYFSVLADETADISGKEQLSIGVRYISPDDNKIHEDFLGFLPLTELNAKYISREILQFLKSSNLNLNQMVGQGYDGCSTMSGIDGGVQGIIRQEYPKALYFHCASHKLNLVINDLNNVPEIRNTVGTIKTIITFFRESVLRRTKISNIPMLSETRWSSKYQSIRIFKENFLNIVEALHDLKYDKNSKTSQKAAQLYCAITNSGFIICLCIIAHYSSSLEPIVNTLQGIDMNIHEVLKHVVKLKKIYQNDRENSINKFSALYQNCSTIASALNIELVKPRIAKKQAHRSNYESEISEEYFRLALFNPYLDSLISALNCRFFEGQSEAYKLFDFLPKRINDLDKEAYTDSVQSVSTMYDFQNNVSTEADIWYDTCKMNDEWMNKNLEEVYDTESVRLFYPSIHNILKIILTLPPTTCTVERSFSTLRRVKTWLRSTISEDRLNGLCLMSIHRNIIDGDTVNFINRVIDKFAQDSRRMLFLFEQD